MEVNESCGTFVSNSEVLCILSEMKQSAASAEHTSPTAKHHPLATIVYEINKALQDTPAAQQTRQQVESLHESLKEFELTPAEFLQIVNFRPTTPIEIQLIVEECEERLSEEKVEELLKIIAEKLPIKDTRNATHMEVNIN